MQISVKSNIKEVQREWQRLAKNYGKAVVSGVNRSAYKIAVEDMPKIMEKGVDRPVSFTKKKPAYYKKATVRDMRAFVGVKRIQAKYLEKIVYGGSVKPGKAVPVKLKRNQFGNIASLKGGKKIRALLARKDTFMQVISGVDGIWQRTGKGLNLLLVFGEGATYRKQFDWHGAVMKRAEIQLPKNINVSINRLLAQS